MKLTLRLTSEEFQKLSDAYRRGELAKHGVTGFKELYDAADATGAIPDFAPDKTASGDPRHSDMQAPNDAGTIVIGFTDCVDASSNLQIGLISTVNVGVVANRDVPASIGIIGLPPFQLESGLNNVLAPHDSNRGATFAGLVAMYCRPLAVWWGSNALGTPSETTTDEDTDIALTPLRMMKAEEIQALWEMGFTIDYIGLPSEAEWRIAVGMADNQPDYVGARPSLFGNADRTRRLPFVRVKLATMEEIAERYGWHFFGKGASAKHSHSKVETESGLDDALDIESNSEPDVQ
jgi:hypothetical protein